MKIFNQTLKNLKQKNFGKLNRKKKHQLF